jgi:hypothetical protein
MRDTAGLLAALKHQQTELQLLLRSQLWAEAPSNLDEVAAQISDVLSVLEEVIEIRREQSVHVTVGRQRAFRSLSDQGQLGGASGLSPLLSADGAAITG